MNNNGALYVAHTDVSAVAAALGAYMEGAGFAPAEYAPGDLLGRIFIPEKRRRLFFVVPPCDGWITIWEDPRYFGDRLLAQYLARTLNTRAVWMEVAGNGVAWAHGIYEAEQTLEERYDETETTFYGEYGTLHFAFDVDQTPDEVIADLRLPYDDLHYEAVVDGELPANAGEPLHLAFEK